jgi:hypothetical protein
MWKEPATITPPPLSHPNALKYGPETPSAANSDDIAVNTKSLARRTLRVPSATSGPSCGGEFRK